MADTKITALTAITTVDPAVDVLPIVDVSDTTMAASGTTKKITSNQILGAGGTATLASATITGDLTVDTSTLKVDSTNNRVGIGTASPSHRLTVSGTAATNTTGLGLIDTTTGYNRVLINNTSGGGQFGVEGSTAGSICNSSTAYSTIVGSYQNYPLHLITNNNVQATLDTSGNLGLGVIPSAWGSSWKAQQIAAWGAFGVESSSTGEFTLLHNAYASAATAFKYSNSNLAARYTMNTGIHSWYTAASGTAGNAITFTQAMTLDASGNLLVGATSAIASGSAIQNLGAARQVLTLKGNDFSSYTLGVWNASTTGDAYFQYFGTEASLTVRGSITYNRAGGLVAYNTTSDYRAKDIVGPVLSSGSIIDSLKVYIGKMKGATVERPMLIAHEAQEVAPYAVTGQKDEVDADGKPKFQQIDVSSLVPLLIAEIKSLRSRVATLENK